MSDLTTICRLSLSFSFPPTFLTIFICLALIFGASTLAPLFSPFAFKHLSTITILCKSYKHR